jgi:hypothetical protein
MFEELTHLKRKMNSLVRNTLNLIQCYSPNRVVPMHYMEQMDP